MEYLGVVVRFEDLGEVLAIRVGDEYLPEIFTLYQFYNPLYTLTIQAIKNIIE